MEPEKEHVLFYITLLYVVSFVASNDIRYTITYKYKCLVSDLLINFVVNVSLRQCVRECAFRSVCMSINYKRRLLLCELYSEDTGSFIENNSQTGPCVFVRRENIDQMPTTSSLADMGACDDNSTSCKECPRLTLDNGQVFGNMYTLGSRLKFTCDADYVEAGNMMYTTCESTGKWSYNPRCVSGKCSCSDQVQEYSTKYTNIAFQKRVNLSSTLADHHGELMVNGINASRKCARTDDEDGYAVVDLGNNYTIYALYIIHSWQSGNGQLRNVSISIGDSEDNMLLYVYNRYDMCHKCLFVLEQPCTGRYMKIVNDRNSPLKICELEVYGELYTE